MRRLNPAVFTTVVVTIAAGASAEETPSRSKVLTIPVVSSWDELKKQRPVFVPDGVPVRLGIEATRIPRCSGVLLYCLVDRMPEEHRWRSNSLGPVFVDIIRVNARKIVRREYIKRLHVERKQQAMLFVRPITSAYAGKLKVRISDAEGATIAQATITVTDKKAHPWTWWNSKRAVAQEELRKEGEPVTRFVRVNGHGMALPHWEGDQPLRLSNKVERLVEKTKERRGDRLPKLVPDKTDSGFQIKRKGKVIVVVSDGAMSAGYPEDHLLVRWWVNGKPFMPTRERAVEMTRSARLTRAREVHLNIDFQPEELGAKPGDRIGMQLLYCPGGWRRFPGDNLVRKMDEEAHGSLPTFVSRLSNRIEWVVPESP